MDNETECRLAAVAVTDTGMIIIGCAICGDGLKYHTHLSKDTSGCKQKCTQFLTLFSGTVFHALSHDVIRLAWSVIPRNHWFLGPLKGILS